MAGRIHEVQGHTSQEVEWTVLQYSVLPIGSRGNPCLARPLCQPRLPPQVFPCALLTLQLQDVRCALLSVWVIPVSRLDCGLRESKLYIWLSPVFSVLVTGLDIRWDFNIYWIEVERKKGQKGINLQNLLFLSFTSRLSSRFEFSSVYWTWPSGVENTHSFRWNLIVSASQMLAPLTTLPSTKPPEVIF